MYVKIVNIVFYLIIIIIYDLYKINIITFSAPSHTVSADRTY